MNLRDTLCIKDGRLNIGGCDCVELANKYGTPLYVLDEEYVRQVMRAYVEGLSDYGKYAVAYASKALSCLALYNIVKEEGLWTDVVSGGELYATQKAGVNPSHIVMHGNNKTPKEMKEGVEIGVGHIVVDGIDEIDRLDKIAGETGKKATVLIRVNPLVEAHTHAAVQTARPDSKFGVIIGEEATNAIKTILEKKNLIFDGLHCHIGSQIFDYSAFELAVDTMVEFIASLNKQGIKVNTLNMGGGFGIYYAGDDPLFTPTRYAHTVRNLAMLLEKSISKHGIEKPFLIIEPGRSIVGEAGITLYTVGTIKEIKGIRKYVAIDGGMFENPRYALYQSKYTAINASKADKPFTQNVAICGKCCESGDMIGIDIPLQDTQVGDTLAVFSTGAYNYSMASNYNMNAVPPMVIVKDGKSDYIVKPQTYDDLIRNNTLPEWLKG